MNEERLTNLVIFAIDQEYAKFSILIKLQKLRLLIETLMLIFITVADQYVYIRLPPFSKLHLKTFKVYPYVYVCICIFALSY